MSVAYYIVLDNDNPGFNTFVNGKNLAKESKRVDTICEKLGIKKLGEFLTMSENDISEMLGEDVELPEAQDEQWFSTDEGIVVVQALVAHIETNPKAVKNATGVLEDLAEYAETLSKAKTINAKWHLNLDI
ncbi:MAG: hypothetical protein HQK67_00675 [Desulfamplus sp.]|nr:hypothetical protein [Desulfamplus sp.]